MTAITTGVPRHGLQDVDALLSTVAWAPSDGGAYNITYSFPTSSSFYDYYSSPSLGPGGMFVPLTATQQAAVVAILAMYSEVANITFQQITESMSAEATLRFAQFNGNSSDTAFAYYPDPDSTGGDSWYSTFYGDYSSPDAGNYGWHTFIHEIGHTLGLKHGHVNEMGAYGRMTASHNSMEYSIMTYASYIGDNPFSGGYSNEDWGYAQSLMMYDITALQHMYGANYNTNNGPTTYSWSASTGEMFINGVGQGAPGANRVFMTLWDGGGEDTYNLSNYSSAVTIDLNPGAWTITSNAQLADLNDSPGAGNLAAGNIANSILFQGNTASLIENAIGGSGNDTIIGNQIGNNLYGYAGNDTFTGGGGDDFIDGGSGTNTASYSGAHTAYRVAYGYVEDLRAGSPDGTDSLDQIQFLVFSDGTFAIGDVVASTEYLVYYYAINDSGDVYYGYFYDDNYSYGFYGTTPSESGRWYYYAYAAAYGYSPAHHGYNYVTDYYDYETGVWSTPYYFGNGGYSGWDPVNPISSAAEYAYIGGGYSYFDDYYEADGTNRYYYFAINDSGDVYYGYFYDDALYSYGYQGSTPSESGAWYYYVYASAYGYHPGFNGYNYATDYYDYESGSWSVPYYFDNGSYSGWDPVNPISSATEYAYINDGYSYFDSFYEADGSNQIRYYAANSSGDVYYGYFYDDAAYGYGYVTSTPSESGGAWSYYAYQISYGYGPEGLTGYNYATDYYDYETGTWSEPYWTDTGSYSGWDPLNPISSASDYAYINGHYAYFDDFWEAN